MDRVKIGLIGCGFFARNHLNAWRDLRPEGADLVAVCDSDPEKARAAADKFGVPRWYTDAAEMLRAETLDLVDIVTQMASHLALARLAAAAGVAMIVQKPLAPGWDEACEIVRTAERAGLWMAVHENFRFQAPLRRVRAVIESGAIGSPSWARIAFRTGFDVYRTQPYFYAETRFAILDVGIHVLDLARFYLGEVERVSCETQRRNPKVAGEDTATMMLRHASGAVSVVDCTYEMRKLPDPFPQTLLEIEGPLGSIVMSEDFAMSVTSDGKRADSREGTPLLAWTEEPWHVAQESVLLTNRHLLARFRAGEPAETSGRDNLQTYAVAEAAYEAAERQVSVAPKQFAG